MTYAMVLKVFTEEVYLTVMVKSVTRGLGLGESAARSRCSSSWKKVCARLSYLLRRKFSGNG